MIKRKTVRKLTVMLCMICCVFCSLSVPVFAKMESDTLTESETSQEIGVYAKTERNIVNEYTAEVKNKKAELTADGNITFKVSKAPSKAVMLVVYYIPATETEAWSWFNECLEKEKVSVNPVHIMDVYFLDESGSRISAEGAEITISCKHCGNIQKICTVDTDGNAKELWNASGTKKQVAFTANGSRYYIIAEKKVSDDSNNDNNNDNNNNGDNKPDDGNKPDNKPNEDKPSDNKPDNKPNEDKPSDNKPDNKPDGNKPSDNKPGNKPNGNKPSNNKPGTSPNNGNQQDNKPQQGQNPESGDQPYIERKSEVNGWENIKEQLDSAKEKDTITVGMNGTTVVPGDIFDTIKGKDITIVFDMGEGIFWKVNGKDVTADKVGTINFGVTVGAEAGKTIPVEIINNVTGERFFINLTLAYDGEFGFKAVLTLNVEPENAGLFANLFYYNPESGELEYVCAGQIDEDGNAELTFTHASDYTIVIAEKDMGQTETDMDTEDEDDTQEVSAPETEKEKEDTAAGWWSILLILAVVIAGTGIFIVMQKKKAEKNKAA